MEKANYAINKVPLYKAESKVVVENRRDLVVKHLFHVVNPLYLVVKAIYQTLFL